MNFGLSTLFHEVSHSTPLRSPITAGSALMNPNSRILALKSYKREEDFMSLREYNDYLEEVEDMVVNLVDGIDIPAIETKIVEYQRENACQIMNAQALKDEEYAAAFAASKSELPQTGVDIRETRWDVELETTREGDPTSFYGGSGDEGYGSRSMTPIQAIGHYPCSRTTDLGWTHEDQGVKEIFTDDRRCQEALPLSYRDSGAQGDPQLLTAVSDFDQIRPTLFTSYGIGPDISESVKQISLSSLSIISCPVKILQALKTKGAEATQMDRTALSTCGGGEAGGVRVADAANDDE
ncbi:CDK-activating kinase assembly factor MAT1 [Striga asiatica]|uniref:CDK-activating kinase assembly factor MAT1 n=1 Tax=Striga asiatica TaxID=4170 RepID=A0A5A7R2E5_STRAF|nr:CDK-activating kinase assembly factor MAT1 [Striga asiatica]